MSKKKVTELKAKLKGDAQFYRFAVDLLSERRHFDPMIGNLDTLTAAMTELLREDQAAYRQAVKMLRQQDGFMDNNTALHWAVRAAAQ